MINERLSLSIFAFLLSFIVGDHPALDDEGHSRDGVDVWGCGGARWVDEEDQLIFVTRMAGNWEGLDDGSLDGHD